MTDRRFGVDELGEGFGAEVTAALAMGRLLQDSIEETAMALPADGTGFDVITGASGRFGDRVMAALVDEPAPSRAGFLLPLRRRGLLSGLLTSVRQALVAAGGSGRPVVARGAALAYVLVLAIAGLSFTGVVSLGAAGALGMLGPKGTQSPPPTALPSSIPPPTGLPPSAPASPAPSAAPSGPATTPIPTPSDDHGGGGGSNSGPGSSTSGSGGDGSGSSSGDGSGSDGGRNSGPGSSPSGSDSGSGPGSGSLSGSGTTSGSGGSGPSSTPEPSSGG